MTELKEKICQILIDMWKKDYIDDNLLFLTTGMKRTKTGASKKSLWTIRKMFC